jgi:hypothetical protein
MTIIEATAGLVGLGLHPDLANREARKDYRLVQAALPFFAARLKNRRQSRIQNRTGFILAVLRSPASYGFAFCNGRWTAPFSVRFGPAGAGRRRRRIALTFEERVAKVLADRAKWAWQWDAKEAAPVAVSPISQSQEPTQESFS